MSEDKGIGLICKCGGNFGVTDSRKSNRFGGSIRRRRQCDSCAEKTTCYELTEVQIEHLGAAAIRDNDVFMSRMKGIRAMINRAMDSLEKEP